MRRGSTLGVAGHGRTAKGKDSGISDNYYVQVHYPRGRLWVTIHVAGDRQAAAALAATDLHNARGVAPAKVRVVSSSQLVREGGEKALGRADADLWQRTESR